MGGAHGCSWGRVCTPSTHELAVGVMSGDGGVWGSPPPHLSVPLPAPDFDPSDWTNEKEKLGLDFPNVGDGWGMGGQGGEGAGGVRGLTPPCPPQLPYLIDGPTKLTQSNAILRYIARKHNMGERWGGGVTAPRGGSPEWGADVSPSCRR